MVYRGQIQVWVPQKSSGKLMRKEQRMIKEGRWGGPHLRCPLFIHITKANYGIAAYDLVVSLTFKWELLRTPSTISFDCEDKN